LLKAPVSVPPQHTTSHFDLTHSSMSLAIAEKAMLPTLLCCRPTGTDELMKQRRCRPLPVSLDALDEPVEAALPALRVKNTFLESTALLSPSLEHFYQARTVHSCPSKHAGRIKSFLEEMASELPEASTSPIATPLGIETPCNMDSTPCNMDSALANHMPQGHAYQPMCDMQDQYPSMFGMEVAVPPLQMDTSIEVEFQPCNMQSLHCDVALEGPVYHQPMCEYPGTFTNYADGGEMCAMPEWTYGSVVAAPRRAVLSLADALDAEDGSRIEGRPAQEISTSMPAAPEAPAAGPLGCEVDDNRSHISPPPAGPALGTAELPSMGSRDHAAGCCRPCAFLHTKGCENGLACKFCHLCGPEIRRRRRQEKLQERQELHRARKLQERRELHRARKDGQAARVRAAK